MWLSGWSPCLACMKQSLSSPALYKLGSVKPAYNLSTQELEVGGPEVQGHPPLSSSSRDYLRPSQGRRTERTTTKRKQGNKERREGKREGEREREGRRYGGREGVREVGRERLPRGGVGGWWVGGGGGRQIGREGETAKYIQLISGYIRFKKKHFFFFKK